MAVSEIASYKTSNPYVPGQSYTVSSAIGYGWITNGGTEMAITFPLERSPLLRAPSAVTSFKAAIRGTKGYVDIFTAVSMDEAVGRSGYTFTPNNAHKGMSITIKKSSAFTNMDNNTPVVMLGSVQFTA